jgi:hypothetical protein
VDISVIDWFSLLANSLWIFGLAFALAVCSYASWQASLAGDRLRTQFDRAATQRSLAVAGIFFCGGLAATSHRWWEIAVWVFLAGAFFWRAAR